ncbi:MAG: divergent polysaccharide deacetylase family protein [Sulfuricurvum sp.]|uniref:divergent polysaccharide deacetylase family protein n=1 Tax=Sulfuricurvum sp. TaxID=2025608 RepID=UPI002732E9C2|nr:divergent polysaccharide deacetylase family protein [Sulfuricurvum sp.]MDP2849537.1 divergent polysaccharide deacetylase family protein [Sulfuricurvum sp.]
MKKQPLYQKYLSLKYIGWGLFGLVIFLSALLIGYFIGFNQVEDELVRERVQTQHLVKQIEQIAAIDEYSAIPSKTKEAAYDSEIKRLQKELQALLEQEHRREPLKPQHEYAPKEPKASPPPAAVRPKRLDGTQPKLVIIIDDVSYSRDVRAIQSTGLPLVMSFLPPSPRHSESAQLAQRQNRYMVHLPLEAIDFNDEEPFTLHVGDSEETIGKRIIALKQLFPNVRYVNNHTGSKFTGDSDSMEKLIRVLKKEGIQFVDSRTIGKTKVPEVSTSLGMRYIGRDVFLDHQDGVRNVKRQIKEAIEKAKHHGTAIAIGHPRPDTIQALIESKELLSEVQLVGIEQI